MTAATATEGERARTDVLPQRFGRYQLFDRIGRGGMAEIFLARAATDLGAERLVVVKRILPEFADDEAFARMLVDEAKLAARLRHANVVQVYDLGRVNGHLFIAMEYVEGYDLNQLLRQLSRQRVPLPAEFALLIVRETLEALSYAHRARDEEGRPLGIVHRDVSPSNVLVSLEGEVKLCDFGIARALSNARGAAWSGRLGVVGDPWDERDAAEARGRIVGKSAYMSPEQARGEPIDARSDIYAAGILLWELCAGRRMIRGTEEEMLAQARAGSAPALPDRGLPEHPELAAIAARALAPNPSDRFGSAQEMARALDHYVAKARLMASPLRFAELLRDRLDTTAFAQRRARERAAIALDRGPPVVLTPLPAPAETPSTSKAPTVAGSPGTLAGLEPAVATTTDDAPVEASFAETVVTPRRAVASVEPTTAAVAAAAAPADAAPPDMDRSQARNAYATREHPRNDHARNAYATREHSRNGEAAHGEAAPGAMRGRRALGTVVLVTVAALAFTAVAFLWAGR